MSTLSVTLPNSVKERLEEIASEDGVALNEFISAVLSQRVAVSYTDSYVKERGKRGSAERLKKLLTKAPDAEPEGRDKLD